MNTDNFSDEELEIINFENKMQTMINNIVEQYESYMRNEENVKRLMKHVGDIPNISGKANEHTSNS